ncbi:MAG: Hpt domain-containing protein [Betaproteobacteria bacterium]|nr:Hpt domain-containing protein [Betaproteobacteria bacterium]
MDEFAKHPVFDASLLDELAALGQPGEPDIRVRLFKLYRESLGKSLTALEDAVRRGDTQAAGRVAHGMKSATQNVGGTRLSKRFAFVEEVARSDRLAEAIEQLAMIREDARQLLAVLDRQVAQLAGSSRGAKDG